MPIMMGEGQRDGLGFKKFGGVTESAGYRVILVLHHFEDWGQHLRVNVPVRLPAGPLCRLHFLPDAGNPFSHIPFVFPVKSIRRA